MSVIGKSARHRALYLDYHLPLDYVGQFRDVHRTFLQARQRGIPTNIGLQTDTTSRRGYRSYAIRWPGPGWAYLGELELSLRVCMCVHVCARA